MYIDISNYRAVPYMYVQWKTKKKSFKPSQFPGYQGKESTPTTHWEGMLAALRSTPHTHKCTHTCTHTHSHACNSHTDIDAAPHTKAQRMDSTAHYASPIFSKAVLPPSGPEPAVSTLTWVRPAYTVCLKYLWVYTAWYGTNFWSKCGAPGHSAISSCP